jgi:hypothetical protein
LIPGRLRTHLELLHWSRTPFRRPADLPFVEVGMSAVKDAVSVNLDVIPRARSANEHCIVAWPDPFVARPNSTVIWRSAHPFVVRFEPDSPMHRYLEVHSEPGEEAHEAWAEIRSDAARLKPYKYTVAMEYQGRVLIVDPDAIVDPDP